MKSELDQLIEYYEMEIKNLDSVMKKCLDEMDYRMAGIHLKIIYRVQSKLITLYILKDPLYEKKESLLRQKRNLEKMVEKQEEPVVIDYLNQEAKGIEIQLVELEKTKSNARLDGQELDDVLFDLAENKIKRFKLHIQKRNNLYLEFTRQDNKQLVISVTPNNLLETDPIDDFQMSKIVRIGFSLNDQQNRLEYLYDLDLFENSIFLKTLIARFVYDVLYRYQVDHSTFIEILN